MPYNKISKIASGTFGTVYKVKKSTNGEFYALKLIHENYKSPKEIKRIKRGFESAQKVSHPNCVKMIEWYEEKDEIGFVMEFVDSVETHRSASVGKDNSIVETQNLASLQEKISKIIQIANGIEALHQNGIVHRDLKPANILETKDGQIKITDFDLVKLDTSSTLTASGAFLGTAKYSSPEQCQDSGKIDHRSDLYSLGILFYKLVTDVFPINGNSLGEISLAHLRSPIISPRQVFPDLPTTIEKIILKLLEKNPNDRFQSASEVSRELNNFLKKGDFKEIGKAKSYLLPSIFVSRENELKVLEKAFSEVGKGSAKGVFILGESGIGKSKLWTEFRVGLNLQNANLLEAKCSKNGTSFEPLVNIFSKAVNIISSFSDKKKAETLGRFAWDFVKIYPPLSQMNFMKKIEKIDELKGQDGEIRLFNSLINFLINLSKDKILILNIEDLQWADELSAKWLLQMFRNLENSAILFVGNFRTRAIKNSPFAKIWSEIQADYKPEIIELKPLNLEEIAQILTSILGKTDIIETEFAEFIFEKTKGSPLFTQEIIYNLYEKDLLTDQNGNWDLNLDSLTKVEIPSTISSVINERLILLGKDVVESLQVASILGKNFGEETFYEISNNSKESVKKSLKAAFSLRFLEKVGKNSFSFTHDSIRETLEKNLIPKAKLELHKKAGEFLENKFSSNKIEVIEDLAEHFYQCGNSEKAIKYCIKASEVLTGKYSSAKALQYLNNAIEFLENSQDNKKLIDCFLAKGNLLSTLGKMEEAENICLKSLELSQKSEDKMRIAKSNDSLANIFASKGDFLESNSFVEKAINEFEELGEELEFGNGLLTKAINLRKLGQVNDSIEILNRALKIFTKLRNEKKIFDANLNLGLVIILQSKYAEAVKFLEGQVKNCEKLSDPLRYAELLEALGFAHRHLKEGNSEEAIFYFSKEREISEEMGFYRQTTNALLNLGGIYAFSGEFEQASKYYQKSVYFAKKTGDISLIAEIHKSLCLFYIQSIEYEKALENIKIQLKLNRQLNNKAGICSALLFTSIIYNEIGKFEEALVKNQQAREIYEELQNKNGLSFCIFYEAKIYSSKKNYAKSLECFDKAISLAEGLNHSHYLAQFSLEKAELLYENGEFKEVKRLVQKSLEITENGDFEVFYYKINNLTNLLKFEEGKHEEAIHFFKMVSEKSKQENITSDALFYITKLGIKSYDLGTKVLSLDEIDSYKEKAIEKAELLFKESNVLLYKIRAEKLKTLVFRPKTVSPDLLKSLVKWMNPETAFSEILGFLTDEYKANGCQIILKNEKTNEFETCAISSKLQDEEIDYSSGILSKAIENQKAILIEDATHTEQFQENLSVVGKAFLSVIAVPLEISGKICGALYLQRTKIKFGFFSKEDLKQVEDIAKVLSPILLRQQEALKLKIESEIRGLGIFVGNSLKMQELYSAIENASKVNFPVYIHGETGTGKELVAGALHKLSNRNSKPFVVLNCATIPKDLAESELFGHEKGSFTGAISVKRGKFELSNGGTLFLDEIGELSLELQAKFLRAIQEKEITRVGGEKAVKIDLRVIVATHKNLENEVKKGNFREDLYHRLNVLKIEVPPLRERSEDIPLLANFFLEKLCKDAGKKVAGLTPDSLILLQEQNWSGNVRELENTIAKGLVMKKDNLPINPKELGFVQKNQPTKQIRTSESEDFAGDTLDEKLDFVMKKILASELKKNSGNKSKTAITLDVKREKLYRLLKKHNL